MLRILAALAVTALFTADASAFGRRNRVSCQNTSVKRTQTVTTPDGTSTSSTSLVETQTATASVGSMAQMKAEIQARLGRCFHPGGDIGPGGREGCGMSSVSADHAIRSCCFYGRYPIATVGVARGRDGWYACVQYAR